MKAASIFQKSNDNKSAAQTFLILRDKFTKDSSAFNSIGWAAEAYAKIPDSIMAARTFETAHTRFPKHLKTPSFIYNAGQMYEAKKDYVNAVRVYNLIGKKYPKSSFAIEAMFSTPLIQEKQGNSTKAAESYKKFINSFRNDPQKLIRAQLAAGRIYDTKLKKKDIALKYYEGVNKTFQEHGEKVEIPGAIPAEAAFRGGEIYYQRVASVKLNASKKENAQQPFEGR